MSLIRNVAINVNSALNQRRWLRAEVARVDGTAERCAALLVRAYRAVIDNDFSYEERMHFRMIESLRWSLLANRSSFEVEDLGAGDGGDTSALVAGKGRLSDTSIARSALSSKSPFWANLLFKLVREVRPTRCVELGTNMGISGAYLASALSLNQEGSLVTLEGAEGRVRLARQHFIRLGLENVSVVMGRFQDTLPAVLAECRVVDFAFIDGHHDEAATKEYFQLITSRASTSAFVVLDDISWSKGMRHAWEEIRADPSVAFASDLRVVGLCVLR